MRTPLAIALAVGVWGSFAPAAEPARPNLIVILADDLGAKELGCYGNTEHRTPHLDRLAASGVKLETCFTPPVCHPTRFTIITGQYGCHHGIYNFSGKRGGPEKADPRENIASHLTFGTLLKQAGYATAVAGKWQLSGEQPTSIRECGFDEYCLWSFGGYYTEEDRRRPEQAGIDFRSPYWHPSIIRDGQWMPTRENDYGPDIHQAFVVDFIRRHRQRHAGELGLQTVKGTGCRRTTKKSGSRLLVLGIRVDNNAVGDGFQLYLHSFIVTRDGQWVVIQQGMNDRSRMARRTATSALESCRFSRGEP